MKVKNGKDILSSILQTTQMGQIGIRSALNYSMKSSLRQALQSQLREYDCIEREAQQLAHSRGWQLRDLQPSVKHMSNMAAKARLSHGNTDSKIAAMMILGNTRGMILGCKNRNQYGGIDSQIQVLSGKLLDCEEANIRQMQGFL